jgi:hypothetical protein
MSLPLASVPVNKKTRASASSDDYDYSLGGGYYSLSRVLTFDYAGFRQRSLISRHFGLRLRGGSGLLGGWRGFFFHHRCRGFIPPMTDPLISFRVQKLVVNEVRLLHQLLLKKIQHLQA